MPDRHGVLVGRVPAAEPKYATPAGPSARKGAGR